MAALRLPDWSLYAAAVLVLAILADSGQERADAPAAPPAVKEPVTAIASGSSLHPSPMRPSASPERAPTAGTAFSVSDAGVWLTARHVVAGCRNAAVMVADGRGVAARVSADKDSDVAVLITEGGSPPLPLGGGGPLVDGERAYHPGFPQGTPGETASRLLGRYVLRETVRGSRPQAVLAWAEVGRTDGLKGSLAGLSGAPVLDQAGRVVGVTLAESPRRGRIYTAPPEAIRAALARARVRPADFAQGLGITTENYGRAADALRRDLRVAQVVCLG